MHRTRLKVVRPVTAEKLLPKSLCGGGGWWVVVVCKPILVFSLSLGQAEQFGTNLDANLLIVCCVCFD